MNDTAHRALAQARLYTDGQLYCLVHLPARAITPAAAVLAEISASFSALLADKDEVTLVLPEDHFADYAHRLPEHRAQGGYRLITFDLPLDHALVGFLSRVSAALAEAQVPIMALSAYERDHLLVPDTHFTRAMQTLRDLQAHTEST